VKAGIYEKNIGGIVKSLLDFLMYGLEVTDIP
jgi:hypothetical protein